MVVAGRVNARSGTPDTQRTDQGSILIMTLVLTVVLAMVVVAITTYAAVGLRSSQSTDSRIERLAAAEVGVWWAAEQIVAGTECTALGLESNPPGLEVNGERVTVSCTFDDPNYRLVGSVLIGGGATSVTAVVQVVPGTGSYQLLDYRVYG